MKPAQVLPKDKLNSEQNDTQYFMVGTIFGGWRTDDERYGGGEQIHEWIKNSEWKLGWISYLEKKPSYLRQLPVLNKVKVGDIVIAKQMDADFKSSWIKAIGICTRESSDGHTLGVSWTKDFTKNPIKINASYRSTICRMSDTPKSQKIINDTVIPLLNAA